ncbi:MAG: hypothetical protein K0Q55_2607 [Verrucomicrobia bacterium]|jgi:hypothetical protein|nr:hypothetical protein [Verrucomicrobiota bacterium]
MCWLLALALMVCACQSDRIKTLPPQLVRNGHVSVASVGNSPADDETHIILRDIFQKAGIRAGVNCLMVCDIMVAEKDRDRALNLLLKSPELKGRRVDILTDARLKLLMEPKVPVFGLAGRSLMQRMPDFQVIKQVLNDAGMRWQLKQEENKITISVAASQKRAVLKLIKNNPALKGIDIQLVE